MERGGGRTRRSWRSARTPGVSGIHGGSPSPEQVRIRGARDRSGFELKDRKPSQLRRKDLTSWGPSRVLAPASGQTVHSGEIQTR